MHIQRLIQTTVPACLLLAAGVAQAGLLSQPAAEEASDTPVADARAERSTPFGMLYASFTGAGEYSFETDFKDVSGDLSVYRLEGGVDVGLPAGERGQLAIGVSDEYSKYEVGGSAFGLAAGDDFKPHIETVRSRYTRSFDENWSMTVLADMTLAGEWDADFRDRATYGGGVLFNHKFNEDLTLGFGVAARSQIEDDVLVLPLINLKWQMDDRWTLALGRGASISYAFDEGKKWVLDLGATYESRRFRLDDGHAGRLRDGVIEDERIPLTVGLTYQPHRGMKARLFAGAIVWQEITAENEGGHRISDLETDPTAMIGASRTLTF
ncbi:MAG: DUF6268 family outer membrane beta-barrel protein [Phycisphaerales bacterium JB038]